MLHGGGLSCSGLSNQEDWLPLRHTDSQLLQQDGGWSGGGERLLTALAETHSRHDAFSKPLLNHAWVVIMFWLIGACQWNIFPGQRLSPAPSCLWINGTIRTAEPLDDCLPADS